MRGLFCGSYANNNEEYKKVIKTRMDGMVIVFLLGCITLTVALLSNYVWDVAISERMKGVYCGAGSGLIFASVVLWIKNKSILGNDEKLKYNRLINTDERLRDISNKAYRVATAILLVALYVIGLVGGLFYPILVNVLLFVVAVFLVSYAIAYKVYEKRM